MDWATPQPIDQRQVELTEPADWRALTLCPHDIAQIESELHLTIPAFLRAWLCTNPFSDLTGETRALACRCDYLIHENIDYRRNGYYGRPWPEAYFWFGDDWGGGAYFVDTGSSLPAVFYFDWECGPPMAVSTAGSVCYTPQEFLTYIRDGLEPA